MEGSAHQRSCLQMLEEAVGHSGSRVIGGCELPDVSAGD